jgi:thiol-disulfide isomerase/thioredoxin
LPKEIKRDRGHFLRNPVMTIAAAAMLTGAIGAPNEMLAEGKSAMRQLTPGAVQSRPIPIEGELPSLRSATAWLNSQPLTAAGLRGKVVLIEFWTYTCINWLRTLPNVRAWAQKYKDHGLVVIGVHSPEFAFEKNVDNVRRAAKNLRVDYPVVIDSDHAIWRAFKNDYWPALYFVAGAYSTSSIRGGRIRAVGNDYPTLAGRGRNPRYRG